MKTAEASAIVAQKPAALHDFMFDFAHTPEWMAMISSMEWIDAGPALDARIRLTFWAEGREQQQVVVISEWERGRRHALTNDSHPSFHSVFRYALEPVDGGTRVTLHHMSRRNAPRAGC